MKILLYLLFLIPSFAIAQSDAALNIENDTIKNETNPHLNNARRLWRMYHNIIAAKTNTSALGSLAFLNTINNSNWSGTALADGNIASAATWNAKQNAITFGTGWLSAIGANLGSGWGAAFAATYSSSSGITNSAPNTVLLMSDGTNAVTSNIESNGLGSMILGNGSITGDRTILVSSNTGVAHLLLTPVGSSGSVKIKANSSGGSSPALSIGQDTDVATISTIGVNGSASNISLNIFSKGSGNITFAGASNLLILKSTGTLSWANFTVLNGWSALSTHQYRVTPDDNLELSLSLNGVLSTNAIFAQLTGLVLPISSGTLVFTGYQGSNFAFITAVITSSTTMDLTCPGFATAGTIHITGSVPISSAY